MKFVTINNLDFKLAFVVVVSFFFLNNIEAKTLYVKTNGTGNGTSWANAAGNIQTMIDYAVSGDIVWIAKGIYYPTTETIARDTRSRTFLMKNGVSIYGGFAGTESAIAQRVLADLNSDGKIDSCELANTTLLSGDIDRVADIWTKKMNADSITWKWSVTGNQNNCYRVVTFQNDITSQTFIDGFSINGGNANKSNDSNYLSGGGICANSNANIANCIVSNCYSDLNGGGIYSSATATYFVGYFSYIKNCKVCNCFSSNGGGIYVDASAENIGPESYLSVINCYITDCQAINNGGGVYSDYSYYNYSNVMNCKINNCTANLNGGGIYSSVCSSYSSLIDCELNNCTAINNGGGIFVVNENINDLYCASVITCNLINCNALNEGGGIYGNRATNITNCMTKNCTAKYGGGIYSMGNVKNCIINNCNTSLQGGGIFIEEPGIANNNIVSNCYSGSDGGGIYVSNTTNALNCTVNNCNAKNKGGGIFCESRGGSASYAENCAVANCYSESGGGGIFVTSEGWYITTSYANNCSAINNFAGNSLSNIEGGTQTNNIVGSESNVAFKNPTRFIGQAVTDAQKNELLTADWHLCDGSSCINAGNNNNYLTEYDIDNNSRMIYGKVDIGAYEYVVPTIQMPAIETFNDWTDFDKSLLFYRSSKLNKLNEIKWTIENQKAVFDWNTNLTSSYSEPLFTYKIDATNASKIFFCYDMCFQTYSGSISPLGTEKLSIEFSTDLLSWTSIASYSNLNGTIPNKNYSHDISTQVAGKLFFIRFNANGDNSNRIEKWEIDNIEINSNSTSTISIDKEENLIYTINDGNLIILNQEEGATIGLYEINGKILTTKKMDSQTTCFNLLTHGVYIVKIYSASGVISKKVIW